jgi:hypothetical protein
MQTEDQSCLEFWYLDNQYAQSTSVGSGKTRAAIEYMLGG